MKKLLILLTTMSFVLVSAPLMADDNKKRRISGVKSSQSDHRSHRRDQRSNRRSDRRSEHRRDNRRAQRNDSRRHDRRRSQHRSHNRHNRHSNHYRSSNRYRGYGHYSYRNYPNYRSNYRYGHHRHHRHNRHYRYRSHDRYGYLLGGVLLGSAIANANHRHDEHCGHDYESSSSRVVTTRVIREGTYGSSDDVHLFRDRNGNCFEVRENRNGDEVREEIEPYHCDW